MKHIHTILLALLMLPAPALADMQAAAEALARKDYVAASNAFRPDAEAGNAQAQYALGRLYELGLGAPADPQMALAWYRKAAAQQHEKAVSALIRLRWPDTNTNTPTQAESERGIIQTSKPIPFWVIEQALYEVNNPARQDDFVAAVVSARNMYRDALDSKNEVRKSEVRAYRRQRLCDLPSTYTQDWTGYVDKIDNASDDGAYVSIVIAEDFTLHAKVDPGYNLMSIVRTLNHGDNIMFSGDFEKDPEGKDCFRERSITTSGSMMEPDFSFTLYEIMR
ncbi:MAG TPA: hypothetical protein DCW68_06975 [Rhodospirillaceae bacterium]|nr:hypothetical protein [Rhodospirillaceae bacterium]